MIYSAGYITLFWRNFNERIVTLWYVTLHTLRILTNKWDNVNNPKLNKLIFIINHKWKKKFFLIILDKIKNK